MDDLSQKITEVLQDPNRMQQIMELANAMGVSQQMPVDVPPILSDGTVQQMSELIHRAELKEKRQQTLIQALLPYLNPKRQAKLEQVMQLSRLSILASTALQGNQLLPPTQEEVEHAV